MDSQCQNNWNHTGKQMMIDDLDDQTKETKREPNWIEAETNCLLQAVKQVQVRRGKVGFNFNPTERHELCRLFKDSLPDTTRVKEKCENGLKVLLKMFKVCHDLANLSGGGWNEEHHRPNAASYSEYVQMVRSKGSAGSFLLTKNFPWYGEMVSMVGGQSAKGDLLNPSHVVEEPTDEMFNSSIMASEQGSSDDPDEGKDDESRTVQSPARGGGSSYTRPGQGSEDTGGRTRHSGSKRKSTDDTAEPNSRRQRYKERAQKKIQNDGRLADAGQAMANAMEAETKRKDKPSVEKDLCIAKLDELDLAADMHDWAMEILRENDMRRKWFLQKDKQAIAGWIGRIMR